MVYRVVHLHCTIERWYSHSELFIGDQKSRRSANMEHNIVDRRKVICQMIRSVTMQPKLYLQSMPAVYRVAPDLQAFDVTPPNSHSCRNTLHQFIFSLVSISVWKSVASMVSLPKNTTS